MAHPPQRTADLLARLLAAAPAEAAPALGTTSLEQFPLRGLIHSVAATALLALLLWGLVGLRRLASGWLAHLAQRRAEGLARRGIDFGPLIRAVVRTVVLGGFWVLLVGLVPALETDGEGPGHRDGGWGGGALDHHQPARGVRGHAVLRGELDPGRWAGRGAVAAQEAAPQVQPEGRQRQGLGGAGLEAGPAGLRARVADQHGQPTEAPGGGGAEVRQVLPPL